MLHHEPTLHASGPPSKRRGLPGASARARPGFRLRRRTARAGGAAGEAARRVRAGGREPVRGPSDGGLGREPRRQSGRSDPPALAPVRAERREAGLGRRGRRRCSGGPRESEPTLHRRRPAGRLRRLAGGASRRDPGGARGERRRRRPAGHRLAVDPLGPAFPARPAAGAAAAAEGAGASGARRAARRRGEASARERRAVGRHRRRLRPRSPLCRARRLRLRRHQVLPRLPVARVARRAHSAGSVRRTVREPGALAASDRRRGAGGVSRSRHRRPPVGRRRGAVRRRRRRRRRAGGGHLGIDRGRGGGFRRRLEERGRVAPGRRCGYAGTRRSRLRTQPGGCRAARADLLRGDPLHRSPGRSRRRGRQRDDGLALQLPSPVAAVHLSGLGQLPASRGPAPLGAPATGGGAHGARGVPAPYPGGNRLQLPPGVAALRGGSGGRGRPRRLRRAGPDGSRLSRLAGRRARGAVRSSAAASAAPSATARPDRATTW